MPATYQTSAQSAYPSDEEIDLLLADLEDDLIAEMTEVVGEETRCTLSNTR